MSGQATGWVLRHGPKVRAQRAVLLTIADAANRDGEHAHPGIAAMIEGSLYSRSRVLAVLGELIMDGWIEIEEEGGGRGRATIYRIPGVAEGGPRKGPITGPPESGNRPISDEKGSSFGVETVQSGAGAPLTATDTTEEINVSALRSDVDTLCSDLADRVANQRRGARPPITERWRRDMRLLLERGPLNQDHPEPQSVEKVQTTIAYVFEQMAEPEGRGSFCWADQIRSPGALRDHWHQMAQAARASRRARRGPVERAVERMGGTALPLDSLFSMLPRNQAAGAGARRALGG